MEMNSLTPLTITYTRVVELISAKYFITPLLSIILFTLGSSFFTTFMSVRLAEQGASQIEIGYIQSAFYAGMLLGAILLAPVIRIFGHVRAYALFAIIASVSVLLQGILTYALFWATMRLLFGISISGIYIVIESWLLSNSSLTSRGGILALYMTILYATQTISHEFLHYLDFITLAPFLLSSLLCCVSLIPIALILPPTVEIEGLKQKNYKEIFKISPFGFMGCLISGFIMSGMFSFIPSFASYYHYSSQLLMQITIIGGCLLQWPLGKLSDNIGRYKVLLSACIITTLSSTLIFIFYSHVLSVYVFSFFLGGCGFTLYTLSITNVCDGLKPTEMISANAILLFVYGLGSILGPLIASFFMDLLSVRFLYLYFTIASGMLVVIGICSHHKNALVRKIDAYPSRK
jgi:MFS family permease